MFQTSPAAVSIPCRGKSRIQDVETGYDYFGARYYDARIGRWLAVDPLEEKYLGWSPYLFVAGNPVNVIDPDGRKIAWPLNPKEKKMVEEILSFAAKKSTISADLIKYAEESEFTVRFGIAILEDAPQGRQTTAISNHLFESGSFKQTEISLDPLKSDFDPVRSPTHELQHFKQCASDPKKSLERIRAEEKYLYDDRPSEKDAKRVAKAAVVESSPKLKTESEQSIVRRMLDRIKK